MTPIPFFCFRKHINTLNIKRIKSLFMCWTGLWPQGMLTMVLTWTLLGRMWVTPVVNRNWFLEYCPYFGLNPIRAQRKTNRSFQAFVSDWPMRINNLSFRFRFTTLLKQAQRMANGTMALALVGASKNNRLLKEKFHLTTRQLHVLEFFFIFFSALSKE